MQTNEKIHRTETIQRKCSKEVLVDARCDLPHRRRHRDTAEYRAAAARWNLLIAAFRKLGMSPEPAPSRALVSSAAALSASVC